MTSFLTLETLPRHQPAAVDAIDRTRQGKTPRALPSGLRLFGG